MYIHAFLALTGGAKRGIRADRNVDSRRTLLAGYVHAGYMYPMRRLRTP